MGFLDKLLGRDKPASTGAADTDAHDHDHEHAHEHPPAPGPSMPEAGTPIDDPGPPGGTPPGP